LPGAKRLMDRFELVSVADEGTTVTMEKWLA
jgi:anti-sigma regulatory factor (Ser/Thr protein kinase)